MQVFCFISLNLPRSFLTSDVFIKKHEFLCIKFHGPAVSQLLNYHDLSKKIAKFNLCVCVCVCVCVFFFVCAYVYVCINVTSQNNVIVATCKTQHRVLLFEM